MKSSLFLSLNLKDLVKGFIMAVIGALLGSIAAIIQSGTILWTWAFWQTPVYAAILAGISYLIKNWITNSQDQLLTTEKK